MFLGEISHSLDSKGRIVIPSKFREELGSNFVITKGLDKCLSVYPASEWKVFEEKLKALPVSSHEARKFTRFLFSGAVECEPDKQGRILLPQNLRDYAGIKDEIVSIGLNNRIEIWNKQCWTNYNDEENYIDAELAEKMYEFGI